MNNAKFGFIGVGNMGAALARAVAKTVDGNEIILANRSSSKAEILAYELGCNSADNITVAANCRFIFLGVKPQMLKSMLSGIAPVLAERNDHFVLVSMAAGVTVSSIKELAGGDYPVIRIMPNTPVSNGNGMIVYSVGHNVFEDDLYEFTSALKFAGKLDRIDESLIDAASAISGCGPAFVYMFAEALADGGVNCGLPRSKAIEYAAQTIFGSASLIQSSGKHVGQLKDEVCSPAGSTIEGVKTLEDAGFRSAALNAVTAAFERTKELGK